MTPVLQIHTHMYALTRLLSVLVDVFSVCLYCVCVCGGRVSVLKGRLHASAHFQLIALSVVASKTVYALL
jgi:hypothetical protein